MSPVAQSPLPSLAELLKQLNSAAKVSDLPQCIQFSPDVHSWPLTPVDKDLMLRRHSALLYRDLYAACSTLDERYAVDTQVDEEMMPLLMQIMPEVYRPRPK